MKYLYILILSCIAINSYAQDASKNYIHSYLMLNHTGSKSIETIQYYDGMGRSYMTVQKGITPSGKNLVSEQWRDETGCVIEDRLPEVTASDRVYSSKDAMDTYNDDVYYTEYTYDYSPLKRIIGERKPGSEFSRVSATGYSSNKATGVLSCKHYKVTSAGELVLNGNYAEKELSVVRKTDEDHHTTYTFKDKLNREVLIRSMLDNTPHDTYYVYDACDNLIYVLPPAYQDEPDLDLYAYRYKYDNWGHCIEKKLPGCQPIKYVYDQADNLIFSQDGVQREKSEWTFYLYDSFHRLTVKGICENTNTSLAAERIVTCLLNKSGDNIVAGGLENSGYSSSFELTSPVVHQVNYYDDYSFLSLAGFQNRSKFPTQSIAANGLLTGCITSVLDSETRLYSATYYDIKGRPIRTTKDDHLGGCMITLTGYTFTGKPMRVDKVRLYTNKAAKGETYKYTYDHADRLTKVTHQLLPNVSYAVLSENTYDELGRLSTKTFHGSDSLRSTYTYNIHNWLTEVKGAKFAQKLYYYEVDGSNTPYYNGNISAMSWRAGNESLTRRYNFNYDGLNRLTKASYLQSNGLLDIYDASYQYNKMGSITRLERIGLSALPDRFESIDDLILEYNGNQLKSVEDRSSEADPLYAGAFNFVDGASDSKEYFYDANGNLIKDSNKNLTSIHYNSLNLPSQVISGMSGYINYQYSADGVRRRKESFTKLAQVVNPNPGLHLVDNWGTPIKVQNGGLWDVSNLQDKRLGYTYTDYCDNYIYEDGELSKILTEEGYVTFNGKIPTYHYYLRDHQGNNRVVVDQFGAVEEVNHYYPYGGLFGEGIDASKQFYKYGNKELDRMHGLDWYDFGARPYDANLGIFLTVDPLCEKMYAWNPYMYCLSNPVKYVDKDGRLPVLIYYGIKAAAGAAIDFGSQMATGMLMGHSMSEAFNRVDWVSVGTSAISSAIGTPGGSALKKVAQGALTTVDVLVDITSSDGIAVSALIGGEKSVTETVIDGVAGISSEAVSGAISDGLNKAITGDLSAKSAATMTKETKTAMKELQKVTSSESFSKTIETSTNFVTGSLGEVCKEIKKDYSEFNKKWEKNE